MDLLIRNARLHEGAIVDIGIESGVITDMALRLGASADREIDAQGMLTLPAFVNGQLHACKSFWRRLLQRLPPAVQALPRFEAAAHVKRLYTEDEIFERVDEAMRLAIENGTCAIRLFGDVDEDSVLHPVNALLRIREKYAPLMTVQVVAFPQDGVLGASTLALMRQALRAGADVVGGIPWIERTPELQQQHTHMCFALAKEFDCDLHFVCDDVVDPLMCTLEQVAQQTIAHGWQSRVSATQCAALAAYDDAYAAQVIALVRQAAMTIFCNSHVALIATDFAPRQPWPRGITRVAELLEAGVPVACGQDDIDNWFYAFGRNDLLEVAQFMAHSGQFAWGGDVNRVLPMVTSTPAQVMKLADYGLHVGAAANLVVLAAADWHTALQMQPEKRYVVLRGRVVVETERVVKRFEERSDVLLSFG